MTHAVHLKRVYRLLDRRLETNAVRVMNCWHCPHSMLSRVYETVERPSSVRLSVFSIDREQQRRAAGLLLSAVWVGDMDRQQAPALSSKCGQCHVDSRGTRLNTDLLMQSVAHIAAEVLVMQHLRCEMSSLWGHLQQQLFVCLRHRTAYNVLMCRYETAHSSFASSSSILRHIIKQIVMRFLTPASHLATQRACGKR